MKRWLGTVISKCWKYILFLYIGAGENYFYGMGSLSFMNLFSKENFVNISIMIVQNTQIKTCVSVYYRERGGFFKSALFFIETFEYRQAIRGWVSVVFCMDWISQFFEVYFSMVSIAYRSPRLTDKARLWCSRENFIFRRLTGEESVMLYHWKVRTRLWTNLVRIVALVANSVVTAKFPSWPSWFVYSLREGLAF